MLKKIKNFERTKAYSKRAEEITARFEGAREAGLVITATQQPALNNAPASKFMGPKA